MKVTGLGDPVIEPEVASTVLIGLSQQLSSTKYYLANNPQESILNILPQEPKEELLHYWIYIQELLKHFWSSYPIPTTYLNTKKIKESAQSDFRHQALDAAFTHYDCRFAEEINEELSKIKWFCRFSLGFREWEFWSSLLL
ncbi:hypothetical protein MKW92_051227 [Papaver armeniacum]|nr:hypothetical protein MKW92_051227 [Papaver armeniacum]